MIPTMLLFGLVVGRFWAVPPGALVWAGVVAALTDSVDTFALAALLGAANAVVGVLVHKAASQIIVNLPAKRHG